jgi:hypothetical protein
VPYDTGPLLAVDSSFKFPKTSLAELSLAGAADGRGELPSRLFVPKICPQVDLFRKVD